MFEDELFHQMRVVFQEHTARWAAVSPGLTKPQYAVLVALGECPGIEQNQLALAAAASKATLAEMLGRLESRGLIDRQVDPADSRRRLVSLTAEGENLLAHARPIADNLNGEMLSRLTAEERATLLELLHRLRSAAPVPNGTGASAGGGGRLHDQQRVPVRVA